MNQEGERITEEGINELTVIASESYRDFAAGLQREIAETLSFRARWCSQSKLSHRNMQQICTEAIYDSVFLAYRVAIPRQRFSFRNVFST